MKKRNNINYTTPKDIFDTAFPDDGQEEVDEGGGTGGGSGGGSASSAEQLTAAYEKLIRPAYDLAIAERKEETDRYEAEEDADALARGMGRSTYVDYMKNMHQTAEGKDIAYLEAEYAKELAGYLLEAMEGIGESGSHSSGGGSGGGSGDDGSDSSVNMGDIFKKSLADDENAVAAWESSDNPEEQKAAYYGATGQYNKQQLGYILSRLTPQERTEVYTTKKNNKWRTLRYEIIASLGYDGYLALKAKYPGA